MTDTLLHLVGALFLLAVFSAITKRLVPGFLWAQALLVQCVPVAFIVYFREVTQYQTKYFDSDIRYGWSPWSDIPWSSEKTLEGVLPALFILWIAVELYNKLQMRN